MVRLLQHAMHSHQVEGEGYIYAIVEPCHYHDSDRPDRCEGACTRGRRVQSM